MDRVIGMAMQKTIAELSNKLMAAEDREKRRDNQYAGMQAQIDALLASGGISPCPGDARNQRPPPLQSHSRARRRVDDQQYQLGDEPTSGEEEEGIMCQTHNDLLEL
ncbi:hypothetical protein RND71_022992 [Anisodus tanguticus]|uniref:Uncharacterized protein n=1 Tax=Anisodus tanguticus TaxID=243964 RepID=A0AAE1V6K8_9SOLA|nr:hypothetical protein RND71_022992 [Anisodus tanguticus]